MNILYRIMFHAMFQVSFTADFLKRNLYETYFNFFHCIRLYIKHLNQLYDET